MEFQAVILTLELNVLKTVKQIRKNEGQIDLKTSKSLTAVDGVTPLKFMEIIVISS